MALSIPPVILAVDQATESGWSLHLGIRPIASGVVGVWDHAARHGVVREAYALSGGVPFLFAYEDHSAAPLSSYKCTTQVLSLGGALWLWFDTLVRIGHPEDMRLGITSRDWRRVVLGLSERRGRDECKAEAIRWAQAHAQKAPLTHDEAEALAIGAYSALFGRRELAHRRSARPAPRTRMRMRRGQPWR